MLYWPEQEVSPCPSPNTRYTSRPWSWAAYRRRRPRPEFHPVRRQPRHRLAGGGTGRHAAGPAATAVSPHGGWPRPGTIFSGDVRPVPPSGAARRGQPAGAGHRSYPRGNLHQCIGKVRPGLPGMLKTFQEKYPPH